MVQVIQHQDIPALLLQPALGHQHNGQVVFKRAATLIPGMKGLGQIQRHGDEG